MSILITCDDIRIFKAGDKLVFNSKPFQGRNLYKLKKEIKQENSYKNHSNYLSTLAKLINHYSRLVILLVRLERCINHLKFSQLKEQYNTITCVSTAFPTS
jgi:hypothetical protein